MHAPRTIAAHCELLHAPQEVDPRSVQRVHNQLFDSGVPDYTGFALTPMGALLSNPSTDLGQLSSVAFLQDRVQFREEMTSLTVEDFAARVRRICELVNTQGGAIQPLAMNVTLRALVNPRAFRDSRQFLRDAVLRFGEELGEFERAPGLFGLRLVFPATEEEPGTHALRIESFQSDPRSLFLENQAGFALKPSENVWSDLEQHVLEAYEFLVDRSVAFVACFDARQETP